MPQEDVEVARQLLAGNEQAFDVFFAQYFPRLYRFARIRLGGDDDAAEEVTQMTLIKGLAKIGTYRGEAALFTWLCSFCRHEIAAWSERAGRAGHVSLSDESPGLRAVLEAVSVLSRDDPEHDYRRRELSALVHSTLEHLPAKYGDALAWKYLDDTSVEEIGRRLGLGYKAAESLLTRAREAFRDAFASLVESRRSERPSTASETMGES
jgi:RNA polymerase sigma-70 factor (ECF subfamily)